MIGTAQVIELADRRLPASAEERSPRMRPPTHGLSLVARTPEGPREVLFSALPEDRDEVFVIEAVTKTRRAVGLETLQDLRLIRR